MSGPYHSSPALEEAARIVAERRVPDETWFRWVDARLRQETVAIGGEPCVRCGQPIPANAAKKHRERHVCSSNCNRMISRKLNRDVEAGRERAFDLDSLDWPDVIDERQRDSWSFGTDWSAEFPFEHGRWVKPGDNVERFGQRTSYFEVSEWSDLDPYLANIAQQIDPSGSKVVGLLHEESGSQSFMITDAAGRPTRLRCPVLWRGNGEQTVSLHQEIILSVDRFGIPFQWWVPVFTPYPLEKMYSPERLAYNAQRKRMTQARSAYMARLRTRGILDPDADYVDPLEIFVKDSWICGICGSQIERDLEWPDPRAASLDHIIPVADGGTHEAENLQASHLICNLSKGHG